MKTGNITNHKRLGTPHVFAVVCLVGLVSACTPTLNTDKLEDEIRQWLEREENIDVKSVSCPNRIKVEAGNTVDCEAETEDGTQSTILVKLNDDEGDVSLQLDNDNDLSSSDSLTILKDEPSSEPELTDENATEPEPTEPEPADIDPNTPVIEADFVETTLKKQFREQSGIRVRSVACPGNIPVKVNDKFNCTITAINGKTIEAIVTQTNTQGGFSWNATKGLISYNKVEDLIRSGIKDQENLAVTPKCGTSQTRYIIAYTGDTFRCTAKDSRGRNIPVQVSVRSDEGQVQVKWEL
ncbi:DUF4333 domain-containing protein [Acaryochloris sp. IP29b_bin.148]|uniref:DUF4333 domain-containing protein n=1 Tax=Acaryochloris sp. IP29b_bin.148 TaxID=2969218 RepID=UPI002615803A|nr:DUF4333 domain-containing protein [Acaryochloris sp. IP29b_bin.148]